MLSGIRMATGITVLLGAGLIAAGIVLNGLLPWPAIIASLTLFWLVGEWRRWSVLIGIALVGLTLVAGAGVYVERPPGYFLGGLTALVSAWTLGHFTRRLSALPGLRDPAGMAKVFLFRLAVMDAAVLLLGTLALSFTLTLRFSAVIALGLLMIVGLSRLVTMARRESA